MKDMKSMEFLGSKGPSFFPPFMFFMLFMVESRRAKMNPVEFGDFRP